MSSRAVHWREGMFLRPHHFQAANRHVHEQNRRNHKWDLHHNWGLRSVELDLQALANFQLAIHSLEARLRDGTVLTVPKDNRLPRVNLRPFLQSGQRQLLVSVAVPAVYLGRRNASVEPDPSARYYERLVDLEDENTGGNVQPILMRAINLQIQVGNQEQAGYEVLPIARLQRSAEAEGRPELDVSYIPPLLSCDAWKPFHVDIIGGICERIDKKIGWLTEQISSRGITFDHHGPGELLLLKQLQRLNEARCVLSLLRTTAGVHPLWAFLELSRLIGQLSIFGATRRPPDLPQYNHDDLGGCFHYLKQCIDLALDIFVEPDYKERPFIGTGLRMQVTLERAWLDPSWQLYIGVHSNVDAEECKKLLTQAGHLDMKIGSSEHVEHLFRAGSAGMRFTHVPTPPRALPQVSGLAYFQIQRDPQNEEWQQMKKTLSLAIHINEKLIAGSIHNQRRLSIRTGIKNVTMQFSLYVLPDHSAQPQQS